MVLNMASAQSVLSYIVCGLQSGPSICIVQSAI